LRKKSVNLKLKVAIMESGKTMSEVADILNMSLNAFSRKVNGFFWFNENEIYIISKFLKKPVTDIFFE